MQNMLFQIINWWAVLFALGLISFPLTWSITKKLYDGGYGISKTVGAVTLSYLVFLLSTFKIASYSLPTIYGCLLMIILINVWIIVKNKNEFYRFVKSKYPILILQESIFLIGLSGWSYVRAHHPDIIGLEKFMDLGFVNTLLRTKWLPPTDMWFAGEPINYYWFGHFITSLLTKLAHIPSTVSYNLMLATILGLTLTSVFTLSSSLISSISKSIKPRSVIIGGLLSAILVVFAGNFHLPFYNARKTLCTNNIVACDPTTKTGEYWYPDATRFIGYDPDVNDKTIHEFPLYSFVVSDLHAHLINLPLVLLYVSLLYVFIREKNHNKSYTLLTILGALIGIFFMTNAWDTANYLLLTGITFGVFSLYDNFQNRALNIKGVMASLFKTIIHLVVVCCVAYLFVSPFLINFVSIAEGSDFVLSHTPLWQLLVLWGLPIIFAIILTFILASSWKSKIPSRSDVFAVAIITTSLVLILIPEIIYVKDIYIASHHRANTMFKLTYQAFVLSYAMSGYLCIKALHLIKLKYKKYLLLTFFAFMFTMLLQYPKHAISSYYGELKNFKGLEGGQWLINSYPDEYKIINWFNESVFDQPVILEAQGDSYTDYNVISSYTGLPTINGWFVHEWLWRGDASIPQKRITDITEIYTSKDAARVRTLLSKYNVEYVIVGTLERNKYPSLNESLLNSLGEVVFVSNQSRVYRLY